MISSRRSSTTRTATTWRKRRRCGRAAVVRSSSQGGDSGGTARNPRTHVARIWTPTLADEKIPNQCGQCARQSARLRPTSRTCRCKRNSPLIKVRHLSISECMKASKTYTSSSTSMHIRWRKRGCLMKQSSCQLKLQNRRSSRLFVPN